MMKLSEVCKIVGVTRRTLQGYDEMGLQSPTEKSEAGYWYYDEYAICRLGLIQIFVEAGYKRKAIKKILESDEITKKEEFDKAVILLKERQKHIDGLIRYLQLVKACITIPVSQNAFLKMAFMQVCEEQSFITLLNNNINLLSKLTEKDVALAEKMIPFINLLVNVGNMKNENPISNEVQKSVKECINFIEIMKKDESNETDSTEELRSYVSEKELMELIEYLVSDSDNKRMFDFYCGKGSDVFIMDAFKGYCELNKHIIKEGNEYT